MYHNEVFSFLLFELHLILVNMCEAKLTLRDYSNSVDSKKEALNQFITN